MIPPLVSFIAWNRMGLTARNLTALFNTKDDFHLHIIDNNSMDGTWEYINDLKDSRIISKTKLDANQGPIHAVNYNLSKRSKEQFFITIDNDVNIHTSDWVPKFMDTFKVFPNLGLLGAVSKEYYGRYRLPLLLQRFEGIHYLQIQKGFVEGCCQCLRPELLELLGYWSEENCMGDMEICHRIAHYTPYKMGFIPGIEIDQLQFVSCDSCCGKSRCSLDRKVKTCFSIHREKYNNPQFRNRYGWKYEKCIHEMENGSRTNFCASIHDEDSLKKHRYDKQNAEENFRFYRDNAN
ncbi:MAG: glycosyltransferase family 2 protein [Ruminiclostridium sp.]|nr:glycosyltransferase family 2 protein [Ruminiclostridium sp.]